MYMDILTHVYMFATIWLHFINNQYPVYQLLIESIKVCNFIPL